MINCDGKRVETALQKGCVQRQERVLARVCRLFTLPGGEVRRTLIPVHKLGMGKIAT
jgi:hypothetical protein